MVVTHRSTSDSYITRLGRDEKFPYDSDHRRRGMFNGSKSSVLPKFSDCPSFSIGTKTRRPIFIMKATLKLLFVAATFYLVYSFRMKLTKRENELSAIRRDFEYIEEALIITEAEVDRAHTSLDNIQSKFMNLLPGANEGRARGNGVNWDDTFNKIVNRQEAMKRRVNELQQTIAGLHHGEALEHFGSGIYHLQFNLLIENQASRFVVEMAPLDLMPHSVNYFMETISAKLWDNTVFTHKSNHILYGELQDFEGNDKRHLLEEKNISTLSFPEYSDQYPHNKYTLGLSGRPGGPEFYINIEDNTRSHGPGGQMHHALHEEADPCFGKVVEGNDVIDWIIDRRNEVNAENEGAYREMRTVIESIRII